MCSDAEFSAFALANANAYILDKFLPSICLCSQFFFFAKQKREIFLGLKGLKKKRRKAREKKGKKKGKKRRKKGFKKGRKKERGKREEERKRGKGEKERQRKQKKKKDPKAVSLEVFCIRF